MEILSDWATPASIARAARDLGCSSVSFTYNDPVIFLEYAIDTAEACHALGIRTIAVTAGYIEEKPRIEFFKHMDATNVDLKAFTERFYKKLCAGKLKPVLETLLYIKNKTKVWLEITNLIIPGENDSEKEIEEMSHWIYENLGSDVPLHFSAFHPDSKMMDRPATQPSTIKKAQKIAQKNGLNHSYTGNISDVDGQTTFCSKCNEPLIERKGYNISFYNLNNINECKFCRHKIAGVFNSEPGQWGSRRQPVRMADFQ